MKKKPNFYPHAFLATFGLILAGSLAWITPSLIEKVSLQSKDFAVSLAVDLDDLKSFARRENRLVSDLLWIVRSYGARFVVMSPRDRASENIARAQGFTVVWKMTGDSEIDPVHMIYAMEKGDGWFVSEKTMPGYPRQTQEIVAALEEKRAFIPVAEFSHPKGVSDVASQLMGSTVKAHVLPAKEMVDLHPSLWRARLVRAVKDRWVRFLIIEMSPSLTFDDNVQFQKSVASHIRNHGFIVGPWSPFPHWHNPTKTPFFADHFVATPPVRFTFVTFLFILAPIAGLMIARLLRDRSPFLTFSLISGLSIATAVAIHGLGGTPETALGVDPARGVKIQLLLPWLISAILLMTSKEWSLFLNTNIKVRHVFIGATAIGAVVAFYVMRSGNYPLLQVTDPERYLRDFLESTLGARPRFKEFFIGHPFLLLGLFLQSKATSKTSFWADGRWAVWLGMIGQISLMNTFAHFHAPFHLCLLRTMNGLWVGLLLSVPLVFLGQRWFKEEEPAARIVSSRKGLSLRVPLERIGK